MQPPARCSNHRCVYIDQCALYLWSSKWLLKFNELKCKVMHIGRNNPRNDYKIGDVILEKVSEERDLGVYLSDDLKPSLQCVEAAKKASSALGILRGLVKNN